MSVPVIGFFNNKGGVGKTSLVYHLAWMFSDLGVTVLAADLDPQANLTTAFLDEDEIEIVWEDLPRLTISSALDPIMDGTGDIREAPPHRVTERLGLVLGDLRLSAFEDELASNWGDCLDGKARAFRIISAFWRIIQGSAKAVGADLAVVDVGPNLGAINRAALIACDYVVVPLAPDLFSLQGLKNLGPTLAKWREGWAKRRKEGPAGLELPEGGIQPIGYVVQQHAVRLDRPVRAYEKWLSRIPQTYQESVRQIKPKQVPIDQDPDCLALLKHYRSLMPMAQEARKPMFHLKVADGAIGAHFKAAQSARRDFEALAREIGRRAGLSITAPLYLPE